MEEDAPVSHVLSEFFRTRSYSQFVKDRINTESHIAAIVHGDDFDNLSAWDFEIDADNEDEATYVPAKGWHELVARIYKEMCKPQLQLN